MIETVVILMLFFGTGNQSSVTSQRFDTEEQCAAAYEAMKVRYGSSNSIWIEGAQINEDRSSCVTVIYRKEK